MSLRKFTLLGVIVSAYLLHGLPEPLLEISKTNNSALFLFQEFSLL
jgi:hypothetical protein